MGEDNHSGRKTLNQALTQGSQEGSKVGRGTRKVCPGPAMVILPSAPQRPPPRQLHALQKWATYLLLTHIAMVPPPLQQLCGSPRPVPLPRWGRIGGGSQGPESACGGVLVNA